VLERPSRKPKISYCGMQAPMQFLHAGHDAVAQKSHVKPGMQGGDAGPHVCAQKPPLKTQTSMPGLFPQSACSSQRTNPVDALPVFVVALVVDVTLFVAVVEVVVPLPPAPSSSSTTWAPQPTRATVTRQGRVRLRMAVSAYHR
jgi:hypothetical protein